MAKYDWNTSRNYVAFLAGELAPGTRRPHHDSELISCYHDAFLPWGHYHNNIVLFYHHSPITRSHFMDPTDRAIKGFYCSWGQRARVKHYKIDLSSWYEFWFALICSAWDRNTSAISKLGDLFSFPSSPTLVEEFQFWAPVPKARVQAPKVRSPAYGVWGHAGNLWKISEKCGMSGAF